MPLHIAPAQGEFDVLHAGKGNLHRLRGRPALPGEVVVREENDHAQFTGAELRPFRIEAVAGFKEKALDEAVVEPVE
jgi:hypothetical protein